MGIRPEHLVRARGENAVVQGKLELVEQLGEYALVHLITSKGADFIVKMEHLPMEAKGEGPSL